MLEWNRLSRNYDMYGREIEPSSPLEKEIIKIGILAHSDGDGLTSAAIIQNRFPAATVYFSNAISLHKDVRFIVKQLGDSPDHLFIVDLAINPRIANKILEILKTLPENCQIHYYDHHDLPDGFIGHFSSQMTDIVHDVNTSASCATLKGIHQLEHPSLTGDCLTREYLINNRTIAWLAAFGGISDHKENSADVRSILDVYDQALLFYQAFSLKNACRKIQNERAKRNIIRALSVGILPSEIDSVREAAIQSAREGMAAIDFIKIHAATFRNITWIWNCPVGSAGMNAFMTATLRNTRVGIACHSNGLNVDMSIRKQHYQEFLNLHKITSKAVQCVGGQGGGSPDETGARIPEGKFKEFIRELDGLIDAAVSRQD
ncbi:MAG: hypothetical protein ACFFD4_23940 [Candidatus Odinarchaeota archaeon]